MPSKPCAKPPPVHQPRWRDSLGEAASKLLMQICDTIFAFVFTSRFAPLAYLLTLPFAEAYFYSVASRFMEQQKNAEHGTYSPFVDAAEGIRFWELQMEDNPARIASILRGWFLGDSSLEIKRGNVREFLLWSLFNTTVPASTAQQHRVVEELLERLEQAMDADLPPGHEVGLRVMAYNHDEWPARCKKPLFIYIALQLGRHLLELYLSYGLGFERGASGRMEYWCRAAPASLRRPPPPTPPPIVLLHGVMGLLPYALLLRELTAAHEGAVLAPIFPHCSLTLEHICSSLHHRTRPHDAAELVAAVRTLVARHSPPPPPPPATSSSASSSSSFSSSSSSPPPKAAFIAHSLGSAFLASLMRRAPELVATAALVDPICFMLPDGIVLRNFLYASPLLDPMVPHSWFHYVQRFLIANEPTVQDCFRTCFWWSQHWLHPSDVPCDAVIVLSGRDSVAEASSVHAYLRSWQRRARDWADRAKGVRPRRLEVELHERWSHGWLMFHLTEQRALIRKLKLMLLNSSSAASSTVGSAPLQAAELLLDAAAGREAIIGSGSPQSVISPPGDHARSSSSLAASATSGGGSGSSGSGGAGKAAFLFEGSVYCDAMMVPPEVVALPPSNNGVGGKGGSSRPGKSVHFQLESSAASDPFGFESPHYYESDLAEEGGDETASQDSSASEI